MGSPIRDVNAAFFGEDVIDEDIWLISLGSGEIRVKDKKFKTVVIGGSFDQLIFEACHFESLIFDHCRFQSLKISNVSLERDVDIQNCEAEGSISLEKVLANGNVDIGYTYGSITINSVQAHNVSVYAESYKKIKKLELFGNFGGSKFVRVGAFGNSTVSMFEKLTIAMQDMALRVRGIQVDDLFLRGALSEKSSIVLDDVQLKNLTIKELVSESSIIFRSVKIVSRDSKFEISSSSFGKARFAYCDFSRAGVFFLNDSFLDEIKSSGSRWPLKLDEKVSEKRTEDDLDDEVDVAVKRKSSFSQMRNIMAASGERYHESQYRYLELDEQVKENIGLPDKVSLWVSKISSNHGVNWVWALVIFFVVNLFLNGFMCLAHGGVQAIHKYFLINYFVILNPLYNSRDLFDMDEVSKGKLYLSMLVFISRIFNAYMYYQIVKSFRKYG